MPSHSAIMQDIGLGTCARPTCIPNLNSSISAVVGTANVQALQVCSDTKCQQADVAAGVPDESLPPSELPSSVDPLSVSSIDDISFLKTGL